MSEDVEISKGETLSLADSNAVVQLSSTLTIDAGGTLVEVAPTCGFSECFVNDGTINNLGNITINTAAGPAGIYNSGTIVNSGNLTIADSGVTGDGIYNIGTLTNTDSGVIVLANTGDETLGIYNFGTITNNGNLTAANPNYDLGVFNLANFANYGYINIESTSEFGVDNGASGYNAVFTNYGAIWNNGGSSESFSNYYGTLNRECGDVVTGGSIPGGVINTYACGPVFLNILSILSGLSLGTLTPGYATLQNDLKGNFTSLSDGLGTLSSDLSNDYSSLSNALSGISSQLTSLQTDVDNNFATLSSTLNSDFSSLSAAIANIGRTGPTVGTSNDATVATSPSFSTRTSFSTSASSWVQISPSAGVDQVVSGYTVSTTSLLTRNAVLYISLTNSPGSAGATYAIPLGTLTTLSGPASGQLRFPFRIPAGSAVYVEIVSSNTASVTVQLQFQNLPINP